MEVKKELKGIGKDSAGDQTKLDKLIKKIENNLNADGSWKAFEKHFEMIHSDFFKTLKEKHPNLSTEEIKLLSLLKMQITTKDIAQQLNLVCERSRNSSI